MELIMPGFVTFFECRIAAVTDDFSISNAISFASEGCHDY